MKLCCDVRLCGLTVTLYGTYISFVQELNYLKLKPTIKCFYLSIYISTRQMSVFSTFKTGIAMITFTTEFLKAH